jgi:PAS domain S-box-containing protein
MDIVQEPVETPPSEQLRELILHCEANLRRDIEHAGMPGTAIGPVCAAVEKALRHEAPDSDSRDSAAELAASEVLRHRASGRHLADGLRIIKRYRQVFLSSTPNAPVAPFVRQQAVEDMAAFFDLVEIAYCEARQTPPPRSMYREVLEHLSVPVILLDVAGRVMELNGAASHLFAPPDTVDGAESAVAGLERVLQTLPLDAAGNAESTTDLLTSKGVRVFYIRLSRLSGEAGDAGSVATLYDMTAQRRSYEMAMEQKSLLNELFDGIHEGLAVVDADEKVLFCNRAFAGIFDMSVEEIQGTSLYSHFDEAGIKTIMEQTEQRRRGVSTVYEMPLRTVKGATKTIRVNASPRFDDHEGFVGTLGAVLDVTDLRKAQEQSRLHHLRLEALVQLNRAMGRSVAELCRFVVHEAVTLTGSTNGFLGAVDSEDGTIAIRTLQRAEDAYPTEPPDVSAIPIRGATIWAQVVRGRHAVLMNGDEKTGPEAPGSSAGFHAYVSRMVAVPVVQDGQTVLVLAVADKPDRYSHTDVHQLELLATGVWFQIRRKRIEEELRSNEQQLRVSLEEKEVLLKEIHHRVKNNMQIISSLMNLQKLSIDNEEYRAAFTDSQNRIKTMALVHEKLYRSHNLTNINIREYVRSLVTDLVDTYEGGTGRTVVDIRVESMSLEIDTAIACGLIVNELVSNSLKYAFDAVESPHLGVSLERLGSEYRLSVTDNGAGLPEHVEPARSTTLGLKLVTNLTHQLGGSLTIERNDGTSFEIRWPDSPSRSL